MNNKTIKPYIYTSLHPKFECNITFSIYDPSSQTFNDELNKWVISGPKDLHVKYNNIRQIRNIEEDELSHHLISNVFFPSKYCILEYFDDYDGERKIAFVVGCLKEVNKIWKDIQREIEKKRNLFNKIAREIEQEFNERINILYGTRTN